MSAKHKFGLRFVRGEDFGPESPRPKEIAEIIIQIESLISSLAMEKHSYKINWNSAKKFGLDYVSKGSVNIIFSSDSEIVNDSWREASEAVRQNNYSNMPPSCIKAFNLIRNFACRNHATAEYRFCSNGQFITLAEMSPETVIEAEPVTLSGKTTLYGRLMRIGNDPPTASILLLDESRQHCEVVDKELACALASRLYERIGVRGIASWDMSENKLSKFKITELTPYRKKSLTEAFDALRNLAEPHYRDIEDIGAFVAEMRGQDEDEQ